MPVGALDVTMHRDDLRRQPTRSPMHTEIPGAGIDDKVVVLVDDVLYSGPHGPGGARRALRPRPAPRCAPRGPRRPWPPRPADPRRPRRQEPPTSSSERVQVGSASTTASTTRSASPEGSPDDRHPDRADDRPAHASAPAVGARPVHRADPRDPRHRGRDARRAAARGQEAADPARAHRGQPLLRGLDPHAQLVRDRRQVALGRRHQHLRQGVLDLQGRVPARHRAHRGGDGRSTRSSSGTAPAARPSRSASGSTPTSSTPGTGRTSTRPRPSSTPTRWSSGSATSPGGTSPSSAT